MIVGRLLGAIWATRKYDELSGMKLMRVEVLGEGETARQLICVDTIGAGIGERVIVATGSAAYHFVHDHFSASAPVDAVIVGIVDEDVSL